MVLLLAERYWPLTPVCGMSGKGRETKRPDKKPDVDSTSGRSVWKWFLRLYEKLDHKSPGMAETMVLVALVTLLATWGLHPEPSLKLVIKSIVGGFGGLVLGGVVYMSGDWILDAWLFDHFFGLNGTRIGKPKSSIYPSGKDLDNARLKMVVANWGDQYDPGTEAWGFGIYKEARDALRKNDTEAETDARKSSRSNKIAMSVSMMGLWSVLFCVLIYGFPATADKIDDRLGTFARNDPDLLAIAAIVGLLVAVAFFSLFMKTKAAHMQDVYTRAMEYGQHRNLVADIQNKGLDDLRKRRDEHQIAINGRPKIL